MAPQPQTPSQATSCSWTSQDVVTKAALFAQLLGVPPRCSRRQASTDLAIVAAALPAAAAAAAPRPTLAAPQRAATASAELQQLLLKGHAARFDRTRSVPAAVASVVRNGVPMRSLVATVDLAANRRVAAYPVELVSDEDDYDRTYAPSVYLEVRRRNSNPAFGGRFTVGERELDNISGVPTLAMYANEPGESHSPNSFLEFPVVRAGRRLRLGDVYYGILRTTRRVERGVELTWCYGSDYVDRGYLTGCRDDT